MIEKQKLTSISTLNLQNRKKEISIDWK